MPGYWTISLRVALEHGARAAVRYRSKLGTTPRPSLSSMVTTLASSGRSRALPAQRRLIVFLRYFADCSIRRDRLDLRDQRGNGGGVALTGSRRPRRAARCRGPDNRGGKRMSDLLDDLVRSLLSYLLPYEPNPTGTTWFASRRHRSAGAADGSARCSSRGGRGRCARTDRCRLPPPDLRPDPR